MCVEAQVRSKDVAECTARTVLPLSLKYNNTIPVDVVSLLEMNHVNPNIVCLLNDVFSCFLLLLYKHRIGMDK